MRLVLVQSTTTFSPQHSLIYCHSTKATLQGLILFHFHVLHAEKEEQLSTARFGVVRSGLVGRLRLNISEDLLE